MASYDQSRPTSYATPAKWLHWIMAVMIISSVIVGLTMVRLPEGPDQDRLFANHEAFGVIILLFALARLLVRATHKAPDPAQNLTRLERIASVSTHHLLYILMVAMPLIGWAGKSAYGAPLSVFGLFEVPAILPKNAAVSDVLWAMHRVGGYLVALLLVAHISGALWHLMVKCDGVFQRMWFGRG